MNFSIVETDFSKDTDAVVYTLSDGMKLKVKPCQQLVTLTDANGYAFTLLHNICDQVIEMAKKDFEKKEALDWSITNTDFSKDPDTVVYTYHNGYTLWVTPKHRCITMANEKGDEVDIDSNYGLEMFERAKRDLETKALDLSKLKF